MFRAFGGLQMPGGLPGTAQVSTHLDSRPPKLRFFVPFGGLQMLGGLPGTAQVRPHLGSRPPNLGLPVHLEASKCLEAFLEQPR